MASNKRKRNKKTVVRRIKPVKTLYQLEAEDSFKNKWTLMTIKFRDGTMKKAKVYTTLVEVL